MNTEAPPLCKPPRRDVTKPDFAMPEYACDCHYHIFDGPSPQVFPRTYTAPPAPLDALQHLHRTLGFGRSVVVQPSIYGTDNRTTLSAMESTDVTKAVVVVEDAILAADLAKVAQSGVVGCRVNQLFQSNTSLGDFQAFARKIADVDWHLQLLVDVSTFPDLERTIRSLGVPVVFDHMGHMAAAKGVENAGFQQLLRLVADGLAWVKLSGAYRVSAGDCPDYSDVDALVTALLQANPERLVWGSDWPHPHVDTMPDDTHLLNLLAKWVPDGALRNRILVDNPAALYRF